MFVEISKESIPYKRGAYHSNIEELQDFLDSGLRVAQYVVPAGVKPGNKFACFYKAVERKGFPIALRLHGDKIYFVREEC